MEGRAVLHAHRQAHARAAHRDFHPVSRRTLLDLRFARRDDAAEQADHRASAGGKHRTAADGENSGLDRQGVRLREIPLDIGLANAFSEYRRRIAYERLLLDLIEGDPTLFVRRDEVEAQWAWIDQIRAAWAKEGISPRPYAAGTWGPSAAIALTERDGISWHE